MNEEIDVQGDNVDASQKPGVGQSTFISRLTTGRGLDLEGHRTESV